MSHNLPDMLQSTLQKVKELMDVNSVVGDPITTPDGVTILPVCKVSYGVGGGGSDFATKSNNRPNYPFGGGAGVGAKIVPIAFLIIKGESVRLLPVTAAPSTTADRALEMVPDVLDRITSYFDNKKA